MTATTPSITPQSTLAQLATTRAGASRVFHRHGLDFCCHGQIALERACRERELDLDALLAELHAEEERTHDFRPWDALPLGELIDHILAHFHEAHREEFARLIAAAHKVERVHGDKPSCPRGLAAHLAHVSEELEEHMQKEEQVLFPMIKRLEDARRNSAAAGSGFCGMEFPVRQMMLEHDDAGELLQGIRKETSEFQAPADACPSFRALYQGLKDFELDLHQHIHLENNILFPRALEATKPVQNVAS